MSKTALGGATSELVSPVPLRGDRPLLMSGGGSSCPRGAAGKYTRKNLELMYEQGRIEFRGRGIPVGKRYLDERSDPPGNGPS